MRGARQRRDDANTTGCKTVEHPATIIAHTHPSLQTNPLTGDHVYSFTFAHVDVAAVCPVTVEGNATEELELDADAAAEELASVVADSVPSASVVADAAALLDEVTAPRPVESVAKVTDSSCASAVKSFVDVSVASTTRFELSGSAVVGA